MRAPATQSRAESFSIARKFKRRQVRLQIPRIAGVVEELLSYKFGVRSEELKFLVLPTQRSIQDLPFAHCAVRRPPPDDTHRIPSYPDPPPSLRLALGSHVVFVSVIGSTGGPRGTRGWILRVSALPSKETAGPQIRRGCSRFC